MVPNFWATLSQTVDIENARSVMPVRPLGINALADHLKDSPALSLCLLLDASKNISTSSSTSTLIAFEVILQQPAR